MSDREFAEWGLFDRIEPIGARRDDLLTGILAATVANSHRVSAKQQILTPRDFMPDFRTESEREADRRAEEERKWREFELFVELHNKRMDAREGRSDG